MRKRSVEFIGIGAAVVISIASLALVLSGVVKAGPGAAPAAAPGVPTVMSYQGLLTDPDTGLPLADGTYNMRFEIYDAAAAGTQLWEEPVGPAVVPVQVTNGVFTVLLGTLVPLSPSVFAGGNTYLEVEVDGQTLAPRQQILSVAYAMVAETLDGQSLSDLDDRFVNADGDTVTGDLTVVDQITLGTLGDDGRVRVRDVADKDVFDFGGQQNVGNHNLRIWDADNPDPVLRFNTLAGLLSIGATGKDGSIQVRNDADETTINLNGASGNVTYSGALIGAFPRPAYDSGFLTYTDGGETKTLNHNIGGDPEDYVVDVQCKYAADGLAHNYYISREVDGSNVYGVTWDNLQSNSIVVTRWDDDPFCDSIKVRIWEIR
jgi:hypothetical protein